MKTRILMVLLAVLCPQLAAATPVVSGRIYSQWYEQQRRDLNDSTERAASSYGGGQLYIRNLVNLAGGGRVDLFASGRATQVMNRSATGDPHLRIYQSYLRARTTYMDLRAGRQFLRGGTGARTGDGVRLALQLNRSLQLISFASASVDWFDPQGSRRLKDFLWAGARLHLRSGEFQFVPAIQLDKRYGTWRQQTAGFDLKYRSLRHEAGWRLFFDYRRSVLDELRLSYTWRINSTWRLPVRYVVRTPHLADREYSLLPQANENLDGQQRSMISVQPVISLGSQTSVSVEFSVVLSGELSRYRQRYALIIQNLELAYRRQSGDGPVEDRVTISGTRKIGPTLRANGFVSMSQYRIIGNLPPTDHRVSAGTIGATWTPTTRWALTLEAQMLDTENTKYDARGFGRLEFRFGGGR